MTVADLFENMSFHKVTKIQLDWYDYVAEKPMTAEIPCELKGFRLVPADYKKYSDRKVTSIRIFPEILYVYLW